MRTALMILVACCCLFGTALVAAQPKYLSFNTYTKCTVSPVPEAPVFMLEICQYYPNQTAVGYLILPEQQLEAKDVGKAPAAS